MLAEQALDLPLTIPWYFGVVIVAGWLAVVVGALALARRLLRRRAERRAAEARVRRPIRGGPPARR